MPESEYYRVLWLPQLHKDWNKDSVPNSTHNFVPDQWVELWESGKRNPEDFPLEVGFSGVEKTRLHMNAVNAFLQIADESGIDEFDDTQKARCGELDGVCAFVHPKGAYDYAMVNADPSIRIAIFRGEYVCVCHEGAKSKDPEMRSHVVRVIEKRFRRPVAQFVQEYLQQPEDNQPAE